MVFNFKVFGAPLAASRELADVSRFEEFQKGEIIVSDSGDDVSVYFILSGRVKISNYSHKGREVWHYELGPGRIFGEIAALTDRPRTANVRAQTATKVAVMSKAEFLSLLKNDSEIALWLLRDMSDRLSDMTRKVYDLVAQNVQVRIHGELLSLCPGEAVNGGEYWITPAPVLAEIARRANTDRESVSREVSSLVKKGVLRRDSGSLVITDRGALEASVER